MTTATDQTLEQRFKLWDVDQDGRIERSDFEAEAARIVQVFGEDPDSPQARAVANAYVDMYDYLASKAGVGDSGMDLTQFVAVAKSEVIESGDSGFSRVLRPTIQAVVNLCDTDGDGAVDPPEYAKWIEAIGASDADPAESFRLIDVNNNGSLSIEELVSAVKKYHFGQASTALLG
jgi:Ca2+-binding EF-hand superfamily protein